jgi:hypothetical protein
MPSTFSPNLRIELIANGEQAGAWGASTNRNLGTLIEQAISGYVTVSVTTANQAFVYADGLSDQARNATIQLTTTTGAAFSVYAPPSPKQYIIYNSSAHDATIYNSTSIGNTTAAGAGFLIPAGRRLLVVTNGTAFSSVDVSAKTVATSEIIVESIGGTGEITIEAPETDENRTLTLPDSTTDLVGANTAQTLTNKTVSGGVYSGVIDQTGSQREGIVEVAELEIDCSLGNYFTKTISANSTFTFSNAPSTRAYAFTLELTHTSGVVTWPAAVAWPNDIAPSLDNGKTSLLVFITDDAGSRWRGGALTNYTT